MIKVGIFDSGIGGLSILKEIVKNQLPAQLYYYADSKNAPYGPKPDTFVIERAICISKEFIELGAQIIIVACNTATAVAIDELRRTFPQVSFIGVEPYINVINQRPELQNKKGIVLATPLTGNSRRFKDLKQRLDPKNILDVFTPMNLAKIIEDNFISQYQKILPLVKAEFQGSQKNPLGSYDFYILGCTHYPLIKKELEKIFDGELISPCPMVANRFKQVYLELTKNHLDPFEDKYPIKFFMSGIDSQYRDLDIKILFPDI